MNKSYRSKEEYYFQLYLDELVQAGYVAKYSYEPRSYEIYPKQTYAATNQLKTKTKTIEKHLLASLTYTPDYQIEWTPKAHQFSSPYSLESTFWCDEDLYSHIDIKGSWNRNESHTKFSIIQKAMWNKLGIYVQKIEPKKLFRDTFTPKKYLLTDKTNKARKIAWETKTLEEYVNT